MSHVATIDVSILDLSALKAACVRLGLTYHENQETYRWYGQSVGDYPLPQGFTASDLGKCEHALSVTGESHRAYEVGVVKRRDGKPGYTLLWDFWNGGYGLQQKIGADGGLLKQAYAIEAAKREAQRQGFRVQEVQQANGTIQLRMMR